jgi:hypothetical protein
MSNVPRFSEVFEGYVDLANQLLGSWTPFVSGVSAKVDAGTYDADEAAADFPTVAKLVTDSLILIGSEAIDALSILTSDFSEETTVGGYGTDPAKAATTRTLSVKDDLKSVSGQVLPKEKVDLQPDTLAPSHTQFVIDVDGDGLKARTYDGHVVATDETGDSEDIFVSVTIG